MHFGAFMEFGSRAGISEAQSFQEGFRMVDAAEEMGLDGVWLAELHFNPTRSVLHRPSSLPLPLPPELRDSGLAWQYTYSL